MLSDETREKWVAALRSGDYEQIDGVLRSNDNKYCCLGVLADIDPDYSWLSGGSQNCYSLLCPNGSYWESEFEMEDDLDHFGLTREAQSLLIQMNDERLASFDEIADLIEAGEGVFSSGVDGTKTTVTV